MRIDLETLCIYCIRKDLGRVRKPFFKPKNGPNYFKKNTFRVDQEVVGQK